MEKLKFTKAFSYPFNRLGGLLNILWVFLPIFGWFALGGYTVRIIQEFSAGKFEELPRFKFVDNMKLGFWMLIKAIPFALAYMAALFVLGALVRVSLSYNFFMGIIELFLGIFVVPILSINFFNKETVESYFEFKILLNVFNNIEDYIIAFLKDVALAIIFVFMSIILIGIPAGSFTRNIFIADFYRRKVKPDFTK